MIKYTHKELIKKLEQGLIKGLKFGFLDIGEALYLIKDNKTYKTIKPNDPRYTFEKYCMTTKDFMPNSSPAGRKSIASKLILIYKFFLENKNKTSKSELIPLRYTKSYELAKFYFRNPKEPLHKLMELGYELNQSDFTKTLAEKGCRHNVIVTAKVCKKCKTIIKIIR